ncbi:MAG: ADP-forming succinate--CoA ligase subunit beta [Planctomycetes bacterium]|jgi:succinyl-CoA synthetase beta subunit|nr:ADP-forming succinate--CoA ligase subunit beta [Planctomycetota bacterium]
MKIHEFQAKAILGRYGVAVPKGGAATNASEAVAIARGLAPPIAVKAQIHAGGRGKGTLDVDFRGKPLHGVVLCASADEAAEVAGLMLGHTLVTKQSGPEGKKVQRVLLEQGTKIRSELYLGVVLDRALGRPVMMGCAEGGTSIEELAAERPEAILKEKMAPKRGIEGFQSRRMAAGLGLRGPLLAPAAKLISSLGRAFVDLDASLAEINPLVVTEDGAVMALDAKINFDDNALFRHPELTELRDLSEEHPTEARAKEHDLSYVSMDGTIGCMVNGAGLAMATMDIIKHVSGGRCEPANFLDVGGAADADRVTEAMRIILEDGKVRTILVNIFGGIVLCDLIAKGIVAATRELGLKVPLVVRLEGTNVEQGREILRTSGLRIIPATTMEDAARKAVAAAGEVSR